MHVLLTMKFERTENVCRFQVSESWLHAGLIYCKLKESLIVIQMVETLHTADI